MDKNASLVTTEMLYDVSINKTNEELYATDHEPDFSV